MCFVGVRPLVHFAPQFVCNRETNEKCSAFGAMQWKNNDHSQHATSTSSAIAKWVVFNYILWTHWYFFTPKCGWSASQWIISAGFCVCFVFLFENVDRAMCVSPEFRLIKSSEWPFDWTVVPHGFRNSALMFSANSIHYIKLYIPFVANAFIHGSILAEQEIVKPELGGEFSVTLTADIDSEKCSCCTNKRRGQGEAERLFCLTRFVRLPSLLLHVVLVLVCRFVASSTMHKSYILSSRLRLRLLAIFSSFVLSFFLSPAVHRLLRFVRLLCSFRFDFTASRWDTFFFFRFSVSVVLKWLWLPLTM